MGPSIYPGTTVRVHRISEDLKIWLDATLVDRIAAWSNGVKPETSTSRVDRVQAFIAASQGRTKARIYKTARVDKREYYKWEAGTLKDSSVMAQRIEDVLSGN